MQLFGSKNCLCWNKFSWREEADISIQDLEEKLFEHALPFIWEPPQMCYAGDVNGSCPQCTECYYGRRETILALWVTCLSGMKKQDKFSSLATYLRTWIKFLHRISAPHNVMWRMSMGQEMSQHPEYYAFRSGCEINQCLRLTSLNCGFALEQINVTGVDTR